MQHRTFIAAAGAALLACGSAAATELLQPDPFKRLESLQAGRVASLWSSLPEQRACTPGTQRTDFNASLSGPRSEPGDGQALGLFSLVDPRNIAAADATVQRGCWAGQLALQRRHTPDGEQWSWDGSALSWQVDEHWRLAAGRVAHHWGPGWDGSLILGTAARPFVNASVEAASGRLDDSRLWWWLGEANVTAFFGQLEDDRGDHDRPFLMGMRFVLRPWTWLEIGGSRTVMWGGEGRSESWSTFWRAIAGQDNQKGTPQDEPGNQLAGLDVRLDLSALLPGVALYAEAIGEDEASHRPDKFLHLAGVDWRFKHGMAFVEWTSTRALRDGMAYQHHIYTDGYRHEGQPLGHWSDGDSRLVTVGALLEGLWDGQVLAVLRGGELNQGDQNPTWPDAELRGVSLQWRKAWAEGYGLALVLDHTELRAADTGDRERDTRLRAQFSVNFD